MMVIVTYAKRKTRNIFAEKAVEKTKNFDNIRIR